MLPFVGTSSPASRDSSVVLPLPELPTMAVICPVSKAQSTPRRA